MTAPTMGFAATVAQFAEETMDRERRVFEEVVFLAYDSIVNGSALTGAPGQPESTRQDPPEGHLKQSWDIRYAGNAAHIFTRHSGAPTIELGTRLGKTLILHVGNGGFHSLELTRLAFLRMVEQALATIGEPTDAGVA
jgi:hypothetical protein